jgi:hypothetical protein
MTPDGRFHANIFCAKCPVARLIHEKIWIKKSYGAAGGIFFSLRTFKKPKPQKNQSRKNPERLKMGGGVFF